jgi:hypothetical protein
MPPLLELPLDAAAVAAAAVATARAAAASEPELEVALEDGEGDGREWSMGSVVPPLCPACCCDDRWCCCALHPIALVVLCMATSVCKLPERSTVSPLRLETIRL